MVLSKRRGGVDLVGLVKAKLAEKEKDIVDLAVQSLLKSGASFHVENLKVDLQDGEGKKLLTVVLSGTVKIESQSEQ